MNIKELAERYIETTKPSELKKQKVYNYIDAMVRIRRYMDLQDEKIENSRFKKVS